MEVKFIDLKAQYPLIREEIMKKFEEIIDASSFISGKYVKEFEENFAQYCGVKHCILVNNGTTALQLALMSLGIGPGDEAIVPVNTFIATAEAVSLVGAKPVFVDCDEKTYCIDVTKIEAAITSATKVILPVHLYGQTVDMDAIRNLAQKHNLFVVEDACQAHGAVFNEKKAGSMGDCGAFSFYPGKNLGAWGEGGAVVTNDDELAQKMRLIREHGSKVKYYHEVVGANFRINEFQGAVLSTKIKYLEEWNEKRRKNASKYLELLKDISFISLPFVAYSNTPVWHLFVIRIKEREKFMNFLKEKGVQSAIHYPFPLHVTPAYKYLGYKVGDFPIAEKIQNEIVSLPMFAELKNEEIEFVVESIKKFA